MRAILTRRRLVVLGLVLLALALRAALPSLVRSQLESRAGDYVAGRLAVGDVDLALLRGAVGLEDVVLRLEGASEAEPPFVAWKRFWVNLGWLALLRRTIRIEDVGVDALAIHLERRADRTFGLPEVPESRAPEPAVEPAASGPPWAVLIDRAVLRGGRLAFTDRVAKPPERREAELPTLELARLRLDPSPEGRPGTGALRLRVGDGELRLRTRLAIVADGVAATAWVRLDGIPLDRAHMHIADLGWNGFEGRLDGSLVWRLDPQGGPRTSGSVVLRDLAVRVPEEEEAPAVAWRRLEVDIERFSLLARTALVRRVALDGAGVLVRPRGERPLPVVPRTQATGGEDPGSPPAADPNAAAWTWKVGTIEVTDSTATVFLEPPPLGVVVRKVVVEGLSSEPGSSADLRAEIDLADDGGTLALGGRVRPAPVGARVDVRVAGLDLARLATAAGGLPVRLAKGALSSEIAVEAEENPVRVSGTLGIADLQVEPLEGKDFALAWGQLDLAAKAIELPDGLPGAAPGGTGPPRVELDTLRIASPAVSLTRTAEGLVLPTGAPAAGPPAESAPAAGAAPRPLEVALGRLLVERGQVDVEDRGVKPFYRGRLTDLRLDVGGLRYPAATFERVAFDARLPGNASLAVRSRRIGPAVRVEASLARLPLAQFNPYVTSAGYSIRRGTFSLDTEAEWRGDRYASTSDLVLHDLSVGGAEGDTLFRERFGIPLSVALALLRDLQGRIRLGVPVRGDRAAGVEIDYLAIVGDALAHALVGALASPLKLLGAVSLRGGRIEGFSPEPVACVPGRAEPTPAARPQLEQLAQALASLPALRVELVGSAGPADERALKEAQVLADLRVDRGIGGALRNLRSGGARAAVREALEARERGEPGALAPEDQEELDAMVGAKQVSDDELGALATSRAERLRGLLGEAFGVAADRLTLGAPAVDRAAGKAEVGVSLGG